MITCFEPDGREGSFAAMLRSAEELEPDVIVSGRIDDAATVDEALNAAESGAMVFGVSSGLGVPAAIAGLLEKFQPESRDATRLRLAASLRTVIAQRLLPKASGEGRIAAFEIMHNSPAIGALLRGNRLEQLKPAIQTSAKLGMITLDDYIMMLYRKGIVSRETALDCSLDREEMRHNMMGEGPAGPRGGGDDDDDDPPPAGVLAVV
jgi:twitching motility protein PilT